MKTCYNLALFCKILNFYLRSFFLVFKTTQLSYSVGLDGWHDVQSLNLEQVKKNPDSGFAASSCFDNICPWTPLWTLSTFLDRRFIWTLDTLFDALTLSSLPFLLASCWAWSQTVAADTFVFMSHWKVIVHIQMQPVWSSTGMNFKERPLIKCSCFLYNCMNVWPLTRWSNVNAPGFLVLEKMISTLALCFLYVFRNVTLLCLKAFTGELHCWQLMQNDSEIWYVHLLALCRLFTLGIRGKTILLLMPFLL